MDKKIIGVAFAVHRFREKEMKMMSQTGSLFFANCFVPSLVLFGHNAMSSFQIGGWLSGLLSKVMPRGPNEMILPDDSKKTVRFARFMT